MQATYGETFPIRGSAADITRSIAIGSQTMLLSSTDIITLICEKAEGNAMNADDNKSPVLSVPFDHDHISSESSVTSQKLRR
jgi:hypothetical protein